MLACRTALCQTLGLGGCRIEPLKSMSTEKAETTWIDRLHVEREARYKELSKLRTFLLADQAVRGLSRDLLVKQEKIMSDLVDILGQRIFLAHNLPSEG